MSMIINEDEIVAKEMPGRALKWLFTPDMNVARGFSMNVVNIKPGNTVKPAHSHPNHEEVVFLLSGSGKAYIDGEVFDIRKGSAILFSPGCIHMLRNSGDEDMKVACFFAPAATFADYVLHEDVTFPE
jgi:quercetin dioxygenase-like cupin family protein